VNAELTDRDLEQVAAGKPWGVIFTRRVVSAPLYAEPAGGSLYVQSVAYVGGPPVHHVASRRVVVVRRGR
jgi:hypothetical protein